MLSPYGLAEYKDLEDARYHCIINVNCTGISSWPREHFPVTGTEMVEASNNYVVYLKTSKDAFWFFFFRYWGTTSHLIDLFVN